MAQPKSPRNNVWTKEKILKHFEQQKNPPAIEGMERTLLLISFTR